MPNSKITILARRPLWIITCYRNNRTEVLTTDPDGHGRGHSLPVFRFEEEAEMFLGLSEDDREGRRSWRVRETTPGELVSVLLAPCADVRQVTLDPLPPCPGRAIIPLCSVARERFIEDLLLMGSRRELAGELLVPA